MTRPLLIRKQNLFVLFIHATTESNIHICSNKYETGLVEHENCNVVQIDPYQLGQICFD